MLEAEYIAPEHQYALKSDHFDADVKVFCQALNQSIGAWNDWNGHWVEGPGGKTVGYPFEKKKHGRVVPYTQMNSGEIKDLNV